MRSSAWCGASTEKAKLCNLKILAWGFHADVCPPTFIHLCIKTIIYSDEKSRFQPPVSVTLQLKYLVIGVRELTFCLFPCLVLLGLVCFVVGSPYEGQANLELLMPLFSPPGSQDSRSVPPSQDCRSMPPCQSPVVLRTDWVSKLEL